MKNNEMTTTATINTVSANSRLERSIERTMFFEANNAPDLVKLLERAIFLQAANDAHNEKDND